jgi:hypothetical protein
VGEAITLAASSDNPTPALPCCLQGREQICPQHDSSLINEQATPPPNGGENESERALHRIVGECRQCLAI